LVDSSANAADWSQYDITSFNYLDVAEVLYKGFNEGVTCKDPVIASLVYGDYVCDASTTNVPQRVRVCNKASCT